MFSHDRRRCLTLLVFLVCVLLFPIHAWSATGPWTFLAPTPTGNTLNDAYSPDGGTTIYHVGDGGLILKQVGTTFTVMDSGTTAPLKGIAGSGPTDIWAVGGSHLSASNTDPIRSVLLHFDGATWTATTPPTWSGFPDLYPMADVWVSATGQAYAVPESASTVAKWNASGAVWEFETVTDPEHILVNWPTLKSIFGFADNDIYAVGSYGSILHRDNTGWSPLVQFENTSSSTSFNLLRCIWGPDADHVYASGNSGQLYRLIPSQSASWDKINDGGFLFTAYDLSAMAGTGADDIWLVGIGGVIRRWTGVVNDLAVYDDTSGKTRTSIIGIGSGAYHLAGASGLLERMDGSTGARTSYGVPVTATTNWKAVGFNGSLWLAPPRTDATTGVSTWSDGVLTQHPIAGIGSDVAVTAFKVFSATDMWFSGVSDSNRILLRGDGTTWTAWQPPGTGGSMVVQDVVKTAGGGYALIQYSYSTVGLPCVVGSDMLYCPLSEGQDAYRYAALGAAPNGDVYAVGQGGRVARWHNAQWGVTVIGENGDDLYAVAAGPAMLVAVGANGCAFYSTDGTTWKAVAGAPRHDPIDGTPLYDFTAVVYAGSDVFWAVLTSSSHWTDGGTSSLYRIQNGQATLVQGGFTSPLNALTAASDRQAVFAAGASGVIMTTNAHFTQTGNALPAMLLLLLD